MEARLGGDLAIESQEKETRHHLSARTMSTLWYPSVVTGSWRRNKFGCREGVMGLLLMSSHLLGMPL